MHLQEIQSAKSFLETFKDIATSVGNGIKVNAFTDMLDKKVEAVRKVFTLYLEIILAAALGTSNKEKQNAGIIKVQQFLVTGVMGVTDSHLCPALLNHSKALVQ